MEIVSGFKEYLIKRLFVNEANVNYRKWTHKNEYTDKELQQIGQSTVNLIEVTKRLPKIIEQNMDLCNVKKVANLVEEYANDYADREEINALVVLDVFPLNQELRMENRRGKRYEKEGIKLIKNLKKISSKLRCPIIVVYNIDLTNIYTDGKTNYLTKKDIDNIDQFNKYVDTFIIANAINSKNIVDTDLFKLDIYNRKEKIGTCKLEYDFETRRFLDYKGEN